MKRFGFTLIELLIVVAIIAILAAIAVPNFLEAQTRAKVSRTLADMRTLATALETYQIDANRPMTTLSSYPGSLLNGPSLINPQLTAKFGTEFVSYRFLRLTTPVSYINTVFPDIFAKGGYTKTTAGATSGNYDSFDYIDAYLDKDLGRNPTGWRYGGITSGGMWRVSSCGPDNIQAFGGAVVGAAGNTFGVDYDASNGTVSTGDIVRVGGAAPIKGYALPAINRVSNTVNDPKLK